MLNVDNTFLKRHYDRTKLQLQHVSCVTKMVSNHIPNDLAFFIISKLPLKSLKRFSCAQKSWLLILENPNFLNMYTNHFISNSEDSLYEEDDVSCFILLKTLPYCPYRPVMYMLSGKSFENKVKLDWPSPFHENDQSVFILGPIVNGIVCLCKGRLSVAVLWNPATDEFKVLPPSPNECTILYEFESFNFIGFGYDNIRDDYSVIRYVSYRLDLPDIECDMESMRYAVSREDIWEIYNLRSNTWRKLDLDMPQGYWNYSGAFMHINGVCHWCHQGRDLNYRLLVSFDLSNEVFCTTPFPSDMNNTLEFVVVMTHLTVINQSIALISNYLNTTTFHISILGEVGVKESWTKLFIIGPLSYIEHPIGEGKDGDLFFRRKDDELVLFNLKTKKFKELGVKGDEHSCGIVLYKKNLLPIGGIND
ncbi:F-box/kelch-repeat protein At3g06240-like [Vicia villosa]|uniref:F-box/kelch-repeat protein At3g06240-like n=1 Tax=Vicia villosa TaxID=3911 RepID=UPI00273B02EE|nr:F-box/kelch-repeat protein At3g06240-like [Vicia villosa]